MKLPAPMTLSQIAALIGGRVQGSEQLKVSNFAESPFNATEGDIALVTDKKLLKRLSDCKASAMIVPEGTQSDKPLILVKRPTLAIQKMLSAVKPNRFLPAIGVHPTAVVDPSAEIGDKVAIGPLVVIGPKSKIGARTTIMAGTVIGGAVQIGEDCLLHPGCLVADYVKLGNRVILQQGASLGSDGFGYVTERPSNMELRMAGSSELSDDANPLLKIPQIGTVILEDDVEIGANTTIDRATIGATRIGAGTKIDNLVMIAHNCTLGREVLVISHATIGGSASVGDRSVLAAHAGVKDHVKVGKDVIAEAYGALMKDVDDLGVQSGIPAMPVRDFWNVYAHTKKLPRLSDDFKALQKRVAQLEQLLLEKQLLKG